jgi:hypothetical protein
MAPARRLDEIIPLVPPRRGPQILGNANPFMKGRPEQVETVEILDDAILDIFFIRFRFIAAEQLVPDDEDTGIIAVKIARIGRMMDAVVRRRVHHRLEPARHPVDRFGMDPILIDQIETRDEENQRRRKADQEQRHPEQEAERKKSRSRSAAARSSDYNAGCCDG